jgi:radical SAM superfamily enzyme YgiQ (UPF0313 family)
MRITFIRPHIMDMRSLTAMEPLVFAILAGLTPSDIELDFFDERLEPIPNDHETDLVGLTVDTYTARRAYQIASQYHKRGVPVVMGGYHPTFLPDEALVYADAVVIGDAEGVWGQLVEDARQGKLQRIYKDSKLPSLDGLRFDRSIFVGKDYKLVAPVQFGRGCRYACDFCSINAFYGSHTRQRPLSEVVAEIKALDHRYIVFVDDNLFVDIPKAEALFRALIPLNIHWACQISIDIAENTQLMDLMAKSGCFCAMIGFETLCKDNLRQMRKGWNIKHNDYETAIRKFRERGIMVYASLVFGYDHDTVDTFDITAEFIIRTKCALANVNTLAPMPGSRLYSRIMNENRLIHERWWLEPSYRYGQAAFHPMRMTADELTEGCLRARRIFHGYGSILKRALDPLANSRNLYHLGLFLAVNLLTRSELSSKLEHRLGADIPLEPPLENVPLDLTLRTDPIQGPALR